jgi:hypothetical protein
LAEVSRREDAPDNRSELGPNDRARPSLATELESLAALHDQGHLTADEFVQAKAQALRGGGR